MTSKNVLQLSQDLISIASASQISNSEVSNYIEDFFQKNVFDVERLEYTDEAGNRKVSLVARKGEGQGGLGFFSHSDTVPGAEEYWNPYDPVVKDGLLYGRGSCDMKGPLAATMIAAAAVDARRLKRPLYVVATADEEVGFGGARQVAEESQLFRQYGWPTQGVVAEPTELRPVYAHKGGFHIFVSAHGRAAHTSTDKGVSANFLIAPFLAEMAELAKLFNTDESFMNHEFDPPTMGFNMVMTDHNCASNVTAARTDVKLSLRAMPNDRHEDAVAMIVECAQKHNLEVSSRGVQAFYTSPEAELVQVALAATGLARAETVPFGTEALLYQHHVAEQVILGPGNIAQAHTVGEYIDVAQLENSVDVYAQLIEQFCVR